MKKLAIASTLAAVAILIGTPAWAAKPSPPAVVEPSIRPQYVMGPYVDSTNNYLITNTGTTPHTYTIEVRDGDQVVEVITTQSISPGWAASVTTDRTEYSILNETLSIYLEDGTRIGRWQPTAYDLYGRNKVISRLSGEVIPLPQLNR